MVVGFYAYKRKYRDGYIVRSGSMLDYLSYSQSDPDLLAVPGASPFTNPFSTKGWRGRKTEEPKKNVDVATNVPGRDRDFGLVTSELYKRTERGSYVEHSNPAFQSPLTKM